MHQDDSLIPDNVLKAVNFYQPNGYLRGESSIHAADDSSTNIIGNYRMDYRDAKYNCSEYPWWDRLFVKAHTQIECDPKVWNEVETLIREDLGSPVGTK
jgi:hypothetical protein